MESGEPLIDIERAEPGEGDQRRNTDEGKLADNRGAKAEGTATTRPVCFVRFSWHRRSSPVQDADNPRPRA